MNKKLVLFLLTCLALGDLMAHPIEEALATVLKDRELCQSYTESIIRDCGLEGTSYKLKNPAFTNLVAVMKSSLDTFSTTNAVQMTNYVGRAVFVVALTKCGKKMYEGYCSRIFSNSEEIKKYSEDYVDSFFSPTRTSMEDWAISGYELPTVTTMAYYLRECAQKNSNQARIAAIAEILSGETKRGKEEMIADGVLPCLFDGTQKEVSDE